MKSSMFYPFFHPLKGDDFGPAKPRTAPALHPGCREANYLPSGGGCEARHVGFCLVFVFSSGHMIGYDS